MERPAERLSPWALRASWLVAGVAGSAAFEEVLAGRSGAPVVYAIVGATWALVAIASFVLSVPTLTFVRALTPLAVPATAITWSAGVRTTEAVVAIIASLAGTAVVFLPDLGRAFVQASAYGAEDRHLLRPPAAYLGATVLSWSVTAAALTAGTVVIADGAWIIGGVLLVVGVFIGAWSARRWHRLTLRWLVVVPAGLVIHDPLVLAETLMLRRSEIAGVTLAVADTRAADLTGPAGGHALQIDSTEPVTAIFAATPSTPSGTAIHLTACLVAPTRPGRALASAARRS